MPRLSRMLGDLFVGLGLLSGTLAVLFAVPAAAVAEGQFIQCANDTTLKCASEPDGPTCTSDTGGQTCNTQNTNCKCYSASNGCKCARLRAS